jgi:hypothetical protein
VTRSSLLLPLAFALWSCLLSLGSAQEAAPELIPPSEAWGGWGFDPRDGLLYEGGFPLRLRPRALLALDYRRYDARNTRRRDLRLDRALVGVEAELVRGLSLRVLGDLRGTDTTFGLEEAWLGYELSAEPQLVSLRLRAGLLRFTPGLEHSLPEETLPWLDYGAPGQLTGRHDLGLLLEGELFSGVLSGQLGLGLGQGFDSYGQRRSDPFLFAKLTVYPLRALDIATLGLWYLELGPLLSAPLRGLFFSGAAIASQDFLGYFDSGTALRNKLFDSVRLRARETLAWHVSWGLDLGPVRIVHELGRLELFDLRLPRGGRADFKNNEQTGWSLGISWRITGEHYDSRPFRQITSRNDFPEDPAWGPGASTGRYLPDREARRGSVDLEPRGGIGTVEIALRYMNSERDRELFLAGLTDFRRSSQEWRALDLALNWYPVRSVRLAFHLTRTIADTARPGGSGVASAGVFPESKHGRDTSFAVRLQLDF